MGLGLNNSVCRAETAAHLNADDDSHERASGNRGFGTYSSSSSSLPGMSAHALEATSICRADEPSKTASRRVKEGTAGFATFGAALARTAEDRARAVGLTTAFAEWAMMVAAMFTSLQKMVLAREE